MSARNAISILFAFGLFFAFHSTRVLAQNSKPLPQVSRLESGKSSPFKDGQTIIDAVMYEGLDTDDEVYGFETEGGLYRSDFLRYHTIEKARIAEGDKFKIEKVSNLIVLLKKWLASEGYLKANVIAYGTTLPNSRMKLTFSIARGIPLDPPELRFVGNENIAESEYIDNFKECSGERYKNYEYQKYHYFSEHCTRLFLFSRGYFSSSIYDINAKIVGNRYRVTFNIHEGDRYRWGDVRVEGAKQFSENQILKMADIKSGEVADGRALPDFVYDKLQQTYAELGFVQYVAEFDPIITEPKEFGRDGTVDVKISIDEGKRFSLKRVEFTGVDADTSAELRRSFGLKNGDVFVRSKFESGIKAINATERFCTLEIDEDVEIRLNEDAGLVDLIIRLKTCPL